MDMWIECLLFKHEDLNSDLHDICNKTDISEHCCNDSPGEAETGGPWALARQSA